MYTNSPEATELLKSFNSMFEVMDKNPDYLVLKNILQTGEYVTCDAESENNNKCSIGRVYATTVDKIPVAIDNFPIPDSFFTLINSIGLPLMREYLVFSDEKCTILKYKISFFSQLSYQVQFTIKRVQAIRALDFSALENYGFKKEHEHLLSSHIVQGKNVLVVSTGHGVGITSFLQLLLNSSVFLGLDDVVSFSKMNELNCKDGVIFQKVIRNKISNNIEIDMSKFLEISRAFSAGTIVADDCDLNEISTLSKQQTQWIAGLKLRDLEELNQTPLNDTLIISLKRVNGHVVLDMIANINHEFVVNHTSNASCGSSQNSKAIIYFSKEDTRN